MFVEYPEGGPQLTACLNHEWQAQSAGPLWSFSGGADHPLQSTFSQHGWGSLLSERIAGNRHSFGFSLWNVCLIRWEHYTAGPGLTAAQMGFPRNLTLSLIRSTEHSLKREKCSEIQFFCEKTEFACFPLKLTLPFWLKAHNGFQVLRGSKGFKVPQRRKRMFYKAERKRRWVLAVWLQNPNKKEPAPWGHFLPLWFLILS